MIVTVKIQKLLSILKFRKNIVNQIKMQLSLQVQKRIAIETDIRGHIFQSSNNDRDYERNTLGESGDINVFFRRKKYLKLRLEELEKTLKIEIKYENKIMTELLLANQKMESIQKIIDNQIKAQKIQLAKKELEFDDDFINTFKIKNTLMQEEK